MLKYDAKIEILLPEEYSSSSPVTPPAESGDDPGIIHPTPCQKWRRPWNQPSHPLPKVETSLESSIPPPPPPFHLLLPIMYPAILQESDQLRDNHVSFQDRPGVSHISKPYKRAVPPAAPSYFHRHGCIFFGQWVHFFYQG